jgi:hypothetical protein
MKSAWCTPIHQGLSNGTKTWQEAFWFQFDKQTKTYKQTTFLLLIDDVLYHKLKLVIIVQEKKVP